MGSLRDGIEGILVKEPTRTTAAFPSLTPVQVRKLGARAFDAEPGEWPDAPTPKKTGYSMLDADVGYVQRTHFPVTPKTFEREEKRRAALATDTVPIGLVCSARLG